MRTKLHTGRYPAPAHFFADFQLLVHNVAVAVGKDADLTRTAQGLLVSVRSQVSAPVTSRNPTAPPRKPERWRRVSVSFNRSPRLWRREAEGTLSETAKTEFTKRPEHQQLVWFQFVPWVRGTKGAGSRLRTTRGDWG